MVRRRPHRLSRATKAIPASLSSSSTAGRIRSGSELDQAVGITTDGMLDTPLPRDMYPYAFGPGIPLVPGPLDPVRRDTGRPEPRIYDYPTSWNIHETSGRLVPWAILRKAADMPIIADCLSIRKSEVATLDWEIGISAKAIGSAQRDEGGSRHDAEQHLRERLTGEVDRLTQFWQVPDRGNGYTFAQWITLLLDERLVLDAVAIYPRRTLGGDMYAFEILDGSTIKPLLDHRGGRPMPPEPAYQQVIHGFPRGEFTADVEQEDDGRQVMAGCYPADQLIYLRDEVRTWTPYGRSAVERALVDLDTWMKRLGWLRAEYTDGALPTSMLVNRQQSAANAWTPSQLAEYEQALNDHYSGDTRSRHRVRVAPPGWEPVTATEVGERYKPEYDLHLLKLLVAHFDLTIHELGFTEDKGLGGAGHAEGQDRLNERKGSRPTLKALAAILTDISRQHLGMPPELEFRWSELDDDDDTAVLKEQISTGLLTVNEGRDEIGRPRFEFAEADQPMLVGGSASYLDGEVALQRSEQMLEQQQRYTPDGDPDEDPDGSGQKPGRPVPGQGQPPQAREKAAEAAAYRRWAAKGSAAGRRFELHQLRSVDDIERYGVDPARVTIAKADEPPAEPPGKGEWAAWALDLAVAAAASAALLAAVVAVLDAVQTAARWLSSAPDLGPDRPARPERVQAARRWLDDEGYSARVAEAITEPIEQALTEGYLIGDSAAVEALRDAGIEASEGSGSTVGDADESTPTVDPDEPAAARDPDGEHTEARDRGDQPAGQRLVIDAVDWDNWQPGDPEAAARVIDDHGSGDGLRRLLADDDVTIRSVADNRLDLLAAVLADGLEHGWSGDQLADRLHDVLDRPKWADAVAITETARAVGAATQDRYRRHGIDRNRWLTAPDQRVCPKCAVNAAAGAIPVGDPFPSGRTAPPAHPKCRCALLPEV